MGTEHLLALIAAVSDAAKRDREIYDREIKDLKERLAEAEDDVRRLWSKVLLASGALAVVIVLVNWMGPGVFRSILGALGFPSP